MFSPQRSAIVAPMQHVIAKSAFAMKDSSKTNKESVQVSQLQHQFCRLSGPFRFLHFLQGGKRINCNSPF